MTVQLDPTSPLRHEVRLITPSPSAVLLHRYRETGDPAAFEAIVKMHGPMVFGTAMRVCRDAHDAEDVTQAAFLTLAAKCRVGPVIESPEAWLRRVARRLSLDLIRGNRRRARREHLRSESMPDAEQHTSELDADLTEKRIILREEIEKLPATYRIPLILHYFGGLERETMAAQLKLKPSTLRVRLHRAREQLRNRMTARGVTMPAALLTLLLSEIVPDAVASAVFQQTHGSQLASHTSIGGVRHLVATLAASKVKLAIGLSVLVGSVTFATTDIVEQVSTMVREQIRRLRMPDVPMRFETPLPRPMLISAAPEPPPPPAAAPPTQFVVPEVLAPVADVETPPVFTHAAPALRPRTTPTLQSPPRETVRTTVRRDIPDFARPEPVYHARTAAPQFKLPSPVTRIETDQPVDLPHFGVSSARPFDGRNVAGILIPDAIDPQTGRPTPDLAGVEFPPAPPVSPSVSESAPVVIQPPVAIVDSPTFGTESGFVLASGSGSGTSRPSAGHSPNSGAAVSRPATPTPATSVKTVGGEAFWPTLVLDSPASADTEPAFTAQAIHAAATGSSAAEIAAQIDPSVATLQSVAVYFDGTPTRFGGYEFDSIERESTPDRKAIARHLQTILAEKVSLAIDGSKFFLTGTANTRTQAEQFPADAPVNAAVVKFITKDGDGTEAEPKIDFVFADEKVEFPDLPKMHTFVGLWELDATIFEDALIQVRYDSLLVERLGLDENVMKLWISDGKSWKLLLHDPSFGRDVGRDLVWSATHAPVKFFAVSAPEPGTLAVLLAAATLTLSRRRRD